MTPETGDGEKYVIINMATGKYLARYDPEYVPKGTINPTMSGVADWTDNVDKAMHFATNAAALRCWNTQGVRVPLRADGKPNKPLTAFTILVQTVAESRAAS